MLPENVQLCLLETSKTEVFRFDMFEVCISYCKGMFGIELIGGWDREEQVPKYGFGPGCSEDYFYAGIDKALQVTLKDIRESGVNAKIINKAEAALGYAFMEFHLKHQKNAIKNDCYL